MDVVVYCEKLSWGKYYVYENCFVWSKWPQVQALFFRKNAAEPAEVPMDQTIAVK